MLGSTQLDSLIHESISRTYLIHLPEGIDDSEKIPLLIAMHGGFGSALNLQNQSQLSTKADEENFIVVYPEGVQGGILNIRTWNAGWCCGFASDSEVDDVGFIDLLLDKLISQYPIDSTRVYATGMSNGGFMSYRLACELSDRIAAIAPVAASMAMVECNPERPMPVIDFHSYLDTSVPHEGGIGTGVSGHYNPPKDSILNVWGNLNLCNNTQDTIALSSESTHIVWSNCECNYRVEQYITEDGGHSWPGGNSTITGDPVSEYINANDLMWDFFQNYSLDCMASANTQTNNSIKPRIYPNPTISKINIDIENKSSDLKVKIYNLMGMEIISSDNTIIDVSLLSEGTYLIKIDYDNSAIIEKFIKL